VVSAIAGQFTFDLNIRDSSLPEDMRLIRVSQGDVVTLRFTTDQPMLLHLHGYELEKSITPGPPTEMSFTASVAGRFPLHIHSMDMSGSMEHESLADIEVWPP
jgi:hypothetical protein